MATARQRLLKVWEILPMWQPIKYVWLAQTRTHAQEYKEATKQKPADTGITLIPNEQNLFMWRALLKVWTKDRECWHALRMLCGT